MKKLKLFRNYLCYRIVRLIGKRGPLKHSLTYVIYRIQQGEMRKAEKELG